MLKIGKVFNYNKSIIESIERHQSSEPPVLQWSNRGIIFSKKDQQFGKWFFYIFSGSMVLGTFFMILLPLYIYSNEGVLLKLVATVLMLLFIAPILIIMYFGMNQIKYFDYKITPKEIEVASWQEGIIFGIYMSKIFLWFLAIACVLAFMIEPSVILVGFGGMAAVGAIAGAKLFSKNYIETHLDYEHILTKWETIEKIKIDTSRQLILIFGIDDCDKEQKINLLNLFCTNQNFNEIEALVKKYTANNNNLELIYGEAYTN